MRLVPEQSIAAVHPSSDLYGSDRMFLASIRALVEHGRPGVVPVLCNRGPLVAELERLGASPQVRSFPVLRKAELKRPLTALMWIVTFLRRMPSTLAFLKRLKVRILYISTVTCPFWIVAGRLAGCRVVVHVHESETGMPRLVQRVLLAQLLISHSIVANSHATADWIASNYSGLRAKIHLVYNAVETPEASSEPDWQDGASRHLVIVGRLNERKGHHDAIEVVAELRRRNLDVGLTILGDVFPGYEQYASRLRAQVSELDLDGVVAFEGFVQDPGRFLAHADLTLAPSRIESFGNAAVESLLSGTPVIAYAVQGFTETIRHDDTGYLVAEGDVAGMADYAERVLLDPPLSERLATAGAADARNRFGMERYTIDLIQALGIALNC